jgi:hypothetical protein
MEHIKFNNVLSFPPPVGFDEFRKPFKKNKFSEPNEMLAGGCNLRKHLSLTFPKTDSKYKRLLFQIILVLRLDTRKLKYMSWKRNKNKSILRTTKVQETTIILITEVKTSTILQSINIFSLCYKQANFFQLHELFSCILISYSVWALLVFNLLNYVPA